MRAAVLLALLIPVTALSGCSVCDFVSGCYQFVGVWALRDYEGDATVDETAAALQKMGYEVVTKDVSFVQAFAQEPMITVYVRGFSNAPGPVGYQPPEDGRLRLCVLYQGADQFPEIEEAEVRAAEMRAAREPDAATFVQQFESHTELTPTTPVMWETGTHKDDVARRMRCF